MLWQTLGSSHTMLLIMDYLLLALVLLGVNVIGHNH